MARQVPEHIPWEAEFERLLAAEFGYEAPAYPYAELPTATSIRLLELLPKRHARDTTIRCAVRTVDLKDKPVYTAISYTWGNPRTVYIKGEPIPNPEEAARLDREIYCDGFLVNVTANCEAFLRSCQRMNEFLASNGSISNVVDVSGVDAANKTDEEKKTLHMHTIHAYETTLIWVDAICINQASLPERSAQVAIMRDIYSAAAMVLVWLGVENVFSRPAIQNLTELSQALNDGRKNEKGWGLRNRRAYREMGMRVMDAWDWQCVYAFFSQAWFSRAWTLQEVVLAPKVMFIHGTMMMSWKSMANAVWFILDCRWSAQLLAIPGMFEFDVMGSAPQDDDIDDSRKVQIVDKQENRRVFITYFTNQVLVLRAMVEVEGETIIKGYPVELQPLLSHLRRTSTRPEDQLYSLLGLSTSKVWRELKVDYSRSVEETCALTSWTMMRSSQSVRCLSMGDRRKKRKLSNTTTWCIDLTVSAISHLLDWGSDRGWFGTDSEGCDFTASLGLTFQEPPLPPSGWAPLLPVRGFCHSTVNAISVINNNLTALSPVIDVLEKLPPDTLRNTCKTVDYRTSDKVGVEKRQEFDLHIYSLLMRWHQAMIAGMKKSPPDLVASEEASRVFVDGATACLRLPGSRHFALPQSSIDYHVNLKTKLHYLARTDLPLLRTLLQLEYSGHHDHNLDAHTNMDEEFEAMQRNLGPEDSWQMTRATRHLFSTTVDRAFFTTTTGHFGTATQHIEVGDELWILAGARVPYVLRPVDGGEYEFVGEAYVTGIMFGEAVEEHSGELRTVHLR